jgi:hypothetical protein
METLQVLYSINDRLGALCAESGLKAGRDFDPFPEETLMNDIFSLALEDAMRQKGGKNAIDSFEELESHLENE